MSLLKLSKKFILFKPFSNYLSMKFPVWLIALLDGYFYFKGRFYFYKQKLYVAPSLRQVRILKSYVYNDHDRQKHFEFLLSNINITNQLVIDVGGNVGYTTIHYKNYLSAFTNVNCIIFEPIKENLECIYLNTSNLTQVTIMPNGLSNKFNEVKFGLPDYAHHWSIKNTGLISYKNVSDSSLSSQTAYITPLDHYLPLFQSLESKLTFIKIDVEGAETDVLLGMLETSKLYSPIVQFEFNVKTTSLDDVKVTLEKFIDIDYQIFTDFPSDVLKERRFWEFYLVPAPLVSKLNVSLTFKNMFHTFKL